jgi:diketogulonate reductase-like aldo/keto reductase
MAGKWLEMLTQITPRIERVAVLFNPSTAPFTGLMRTIEDAAPILAVAARAAPVGDDALEAIARRKNATLAQLAIAWPMAQGSRAGAFIVPIPGAKSRKHLEENVRAADIVLTADDFAEIDIIKLASGPLF